MFLGKIYETIVIPLFKKETLETIVPLLLKLLGNFNVLRKKI